MMTALPSDWFTDPESILLTAFNGTTQPVDIEEEGLCPLSDHGQTMAEQKHPYSKNVGIEILERNII